MRYLICFFFTIQVAVWGQSIPSCLPTLCVPAIVRAVKDSTSPFILKELQSGSTNQAADRINLIVVGKGYNTFDAFLATARRDIAFGGDEIFDNNTIDKVLFGLFATEPFKSQRNKFNVWYYPVQITGNPADFALQQANTPTPNFGLNFVSYLFVVNPDNDPQSYAYPSNVAPGVPPTKAGLVFGTASVLRYANLGDGMSVVAHELGHSLFNLRDEYLRISPELGDRYGHNLARTNTDAQALWGDVVGQVDPFYYTWKAKMQRYGIWIDKSTPSCRFDDKTQINVCTWHADESDIRVGYVPGGGITTTGISVRPTFTSLMNNEDVLDKSWPKFPPVFGMANRKVMEAVLNLFSGN